jgi:outer membrane protein OmpA-like peptidoglycan-associated protein
MKKFIFFARVGLLFTVVFLQPAVGARFQSQSDDYPNYVVIGAFAVQQNAVKFTREANALKLRAQFEINPNRNLYYVYVLNTSDHEEAIAEALRLRRESKYTDAWVYHGAIGKNIVDVAGGRDINPETKKPIAVSPQEPINAQVQNKVYVDTVAQTAVAGPAMPPNEESKSKFTETTLTVEEVAAKNFVFNLFRATDGEIVEGDVDVIDTEKSRKMVTLKGNIPVKVTAPAGKSGAVSFLCEVFGYRKSQIEFAFKNPEQSVTIDEAGNIVIPFELVRLQKGDIAVMYNVFFFKDAAIMRPESRFEVNNLMEMMKENPNYKIRIHGHTNGNASGKIITMGQSQNFFSLNDTQDGYGSAKKLSETRASAIKQYLVSNGIAEERMQIKAWGGKRPIHDKHATRAQENVRVEVEIISN